MVSICFPVAAQAVQQALVTMFSVDDDARLERVALGAPLAAFENNSEVKRLGFDLQPVSFLQQQPHPPYAARGRPSLICFGGHVRDI